LTVIHRRNGLRTHASDDRVTSREVSASILRASLVRPRPDRSSTQLAQQAAVKVALLVHRESLPEVKERRMLGDDLVDP
jgi:hypothetical protein